MTDKRPPQTIQCFLPQGEPRGILRAVIPVRIVGPFREGRYDCGEVQAVVVYSEPMP